MARTKNKKIEEDDDALLDQDSTVGNDDELNNDEVEDVQLSDIPIEQFLKDPKMSMLTEDNEVEETTAWCPVCNEYTIFVDKICTVCGFVKGIKKSESNKDDEEESEGTFELASTEDTIDEMSMYGGGDDVYNDDQYSDY